MFDNLLLTLKLIKENAIIVRTNLNHFLVFLGATGFALLKCFVIFIVLTNILLIALNFFTNKVLAPTTLIIIRAKLGTYVYIWAFLESLASY